MEEDISKHFVGPYGDELIGGIIDDPNYLEYLEQEKLKQKEMEKPTNYSITIDVLEHYNTLTKKEKLLLNYILTEVNKYYPDIQLCTEDIKEIIECDKQPVISKALTTLIRKGFIIKTTKRKTCGYHTYKLNDEYFKII